MSKEENNKTRYCVQWNAHERYMCTVLCSLMEHQSLVDLAICCGNSTIHVHKCILAANSTYFREQLEKNTSAEQVIINGLDFVIIKSIIEFIYCGETIVPDDNMKYMIAAAKVFQIRGLQALASEVTEFSGGSSGDQVYIPPPIFISKKPKYPTAFRPFNNFSTHQPNMNKTISPYEQLLQRKIKRKYMRTEAERACAKEAAASRQALEALQKELAIQPQVNSFVIEESCTETTVENFIPHTDERFVDNVRDFQGLPVVNYYSVNGTGYANRGQTANIDKAFAPNSLLQFNIRNDNTAQPDLTTDKMKNVLGSDITNNVEIMFKTSEGDFVSVTDEILQNITKSALQYQVIDENGFAGEMQELRVLNKVIVDPSDVSQKYIYDQNGLNPSDVETGLSEIPKLDRNTVEAEQSEGKLALEASDTLKDLQSQDSKPEIESCLDLLQFPTHSLNTSSAADLDSEKAALVPVTTTESSHFNLCALNNCEENTNTFSCTNESQDNELGQADTETKQRLICTEEEKDVCVDVELVNQYIESAPISTIMEFSPRKTRSTGKRPLMEIEDIEDNKNDVKRDKTKRCSLTRKFK